MQELEKARDAALAGGSGENVLLLILAYGCLIWYVFIVAVQAIGSTQL